MKKILIVLLFTLILTGCSNSINNGKITCDEKETLMKEDAVLIDVRTKEEYDERHLDNAINIPYDKIVNEIKNYDTIDKGTKIIVYCKSGIRSGKAYAALKDAGYTNLYDLGAMSNCE